MKKLIIFILVVVCIGVLYSYEPFFTETPVISPDGELIAFVYLNDIWEVAYEGGVARRLTSGDDRVWRPSYSPNGQKLVFHSDRSGRNLLYQIPSSGGQAELLSSEEFYFCDWFSDGTSILAIGNDPGENALFYKIELNNRRPLEIGIMGNHFSTISPDGSTIVYNRRGLPHRPAYKGSHTGQLWTYHIPTKEHKQITNFPFSSRYPKFSFINPNRLYFASSDSLQFQLCYMENFDETTKTILSNFQDFSVRNISIARNSDRIVFEYFNEIWRYDPDSGECEKVIIEILEDNFPYPKVHETFKNELTNFSISPNQELLVFSQRYDLFAVPVQGGKVKQITFHQKGIEDIMIMDDNETIYFVSYQQGKPILFKTNILNTNNIEQISWFSDKYVTRLAKNLNGELIVVFDKGDTQTERRVYATIDINNKITEILPNEKIISYPDYSSDSSQLVYFAADSENQNNILRIKDVNTGEYSDIYVTTDWVGSSMLTEDHNQLIYNMGNTVYILDLTFIPNEKEDHWDKILKTNKPNTSKQQNIWDTNADNFHLRNKPLISESGYSYPLYTTADSLVFYITHSGSNRLVKKTKLDGSKTEDIFTINGAIDSYLVFEDQSILYYLSNNKLYCLNLKNKQNNQINFEFDYIYDNIVLNKDVFEQIWGRFGHYFYDPAMHSQDWEFIYKKFSPYTKNLLNTAHLTKVIDEMIGRVNASHTGFYPRPTPNVFNLDRAYAGITFDYNSRLPVGIRIKDVYHNSELFQKYNIAENDLVLEVNGTPIYDSTEITPLFINLVNKDIELKIQKQNGIIEAKITGLSGMQQYQMRYEDWVLRNYRTVQTITNNRIGYLHIQRMNRASLRKFEHDFLAVNAKTDAMIIDVRGNSGGNISNQLVEFITRQQSAFTYGRSWGIEPMRNPSNIYQKPIICLIDEDSYSDAEVFSAAFQDLKLGIIVGMPTSGSVIGTGTEEFMDGSSIRMPRHAWFRLNKENMELKGTTPDVFVPLLPHHILSKEDPQLEKAIEILQDLIK